MRIFSLDPYDLDQHMRGAEMAMWQKPSAQVRPDCRVSIVDVLRLATMPGEGKASGLTEAKPSIGRRMTEVREDREVGRRLG